MQETNEVTAVLDVIIRVVLVAATSSLFGIVFLAYWRLKSSKMLFISIGFGSFVAYAFSTLFEILGQPLVYDANFHLFLHIIALAFILAGILKD
jgi:hypothetical protein